MDAHNIDDFMADEIRNRQAADENVKPHQILSAGDFFLRHSHGFAIYGQILDLSTHLLDGESLESLDEDARAEHDEELAVYAQPHMKFYRFAKCYSQVCSYGELGDIHLSTVERKLTAQEFEAAYRCGWRE